MSTGKYWTQLLLVILLRMHEDTKTTLIWSMVGDKERNAIEEK